MNGKKGRKQFRRQENMNLVFSAALDCSTKSSPLNSGMKGAMECQISWGWVQPFNGSTGYLDILF